MTSIVLFGSMGVAVDCLAWLLEQPDLDLLGVVCSRDPMSPWRAAACDRNMREEAPRMGVPLLYMDEMPRADIGLSVRFHRLLRRRHLDRFARGVINLHGAPLPDLRGSMCECVALFEGHKSYGTSLHWMDEGVDSGDLLICERFAITPADTTMTLLERANGIGLAMIKQNLRPILAGEIRAVRQQGGRSFTKASATALLSARAAA